MHMELLGIMYTELLPVKWKCAAKLTYQDIYLGWLWLISDSYKNDWVVIMGNTNVK